MIFCIFSYNRGRFLEHCVHSIEQAVAGARLCVFDDNSDDPETRKVLDRVAQKHEVVRAGEADESKHGGLYGNMQRALEKFAEEPLVCFLQDDMQLVRPLSPEDMDGYRDYFEAVATRGFLQPCFLKGSSREQDTRTLVPDAGLGIYQRHGSRESAGIYYSDIFIAKPARLLKAGWRFAGSEPANDQQARQSFGRMGYLVSPFAMWLPEVPAYRGKRKTLALKIAEKKRKCGFYPFKMMTKQAVRELKQRSPDALPFAEDYLICSAWLSRPWSYYPLQGSRFLKKLNSYELFFRRHFGKKAGVTTKKPE